MASRCAGLVVRARVLSASARLEKSSPRFECWCEPIVRCSAALFTSPCSNAATPAAFHSYDAFSTESGIEIGKSYSSSGSAVAHVLQVTRHLSATRRPARLASGRDSVQSSMNGISHREPRSGHPIDGLGQPSSEHGQGPRSTQGSPVASECIMPSWCTMERSADATTHCEPSSSNCAKPQFIKHAREILSEKRRVRNACGRQGARRFGPRRTFQFASVTVTVTNKSRTTGTCHHVSFLAWYGNSRRSSCADFAHTCGVVPRIRGLGFDLATGRG